MNRQSQRWVDYTTFLGVAIGSSLMWKNHTQLIVSNIAHGTEILSKLKHSFLNKFFLHKTYAYLPILHWLHLCKVWPVQYYTKYYTKHYSKFVILHIPFPILMIIVINYLPHWIPFNFLTWSIFSIATFSYHSINNLHRSTIISLNTTETYTIQDRQNTFTNHVLTLTSLNKAYTAELSPATY